MPRKLIKAKNPINQLMSNLKNTQKHFFLWFSGVWLKNYRHLLNWLVLLLLHTNYQSNHRYLRNVMYSSSSSSSCSSGIFPAVNISRTVCPIRLCKVSKEAARRAGFNGAHHFGVKCPSGGENWNQTNYLTVFFFSFLKNRLKAISSNHSSEKRKFLDNLETHLHTNFHEDPMISYRENRQTWLKTGIFGHSCIN